jgi:arabinofuranan 3-O-arabinosyltransferase
MGAALAVLALMAALRMSPTAAVVGTAVYVLNPYMISVVITYPVYMAAVGLLALMPAVLLAVGAGRLSIRWAAGLLAIASPLLGYIFFNPPLTGVVLAAILIAPLLVGWIDGKEAALRSLSALLLAVPFSIAASAYWIAPAFLHLSNSPNSQLASLSSWIWTEGRASLRNAFWLNTHWGWKYPEFFTYARAYDSVPLSVARFVLPLMAFGALALMALPATRSSSGIRLSRLTVAAASVALIVIFLSTGTNPPGNIAFDRLYNLPLGWLLREPGRFLLVAGLAYAVLVAAAVDMLLNHHLLIDSLSLRRLASDLPRATYVAVAFGTMLLLGFPIYTGAVVPDGRPSLPPAHIHFPGYWQDMARFVDQLPTPGALLVMPPDDFYQMPYTWGYYGADSFVVNMFQRPVLLPNEQGYTSTSSEIVSAVDLAARSILDHDWLQAESLARALNTPLVLVRRDIHAPYPGRSIISPSDLANALYMAPNFVLVRAIGPLDLFAVAGVMSKTEVVTHFITVESQTPDLRLLSLLPAHAAVVYGRPQVGFASAVLAPPVELWPRNGSVFSWQESTPPGRLYQLADLDSRMVLPLDGAGTFAEGLSGARAVYAPDDPNNGLTVSIVGRMAISNGDFASGPWQPVSDCFNALPTPAIPYLGATVSTGSAPGGLPALRLTASAHIACESQSVDWRGGPLVISLMTRAVEGPGPRMCLWETGLNRCASLPRLPDNPAWSTYRASITPDIGATAVSLFLYADVYQPHTRTTNDYANISIVEVPALPSLVLLGDPQTQPPPPLQLIVVHTSFSADWLGSTGGEHVLVDGMLNGWLVPAGTRDFSAYYKPADVFWAAQLISLVTGLAAVLIALLLCLRHLVRTRQMK